MKRTAAHASDILARKLIANGENGHELNFPDDDTEEITPSIYMGVSYHKKDKKWLVWRHSKKEKKMINNRSYKNEETAAHASDILARKLMANGEEGHELNFPKDHTTMHPKVRPEENKTSKFIGVSYKLNRSMWSVMRRSKHKNKMIYNGTYKKEKTAAHASDALARKLTANGEENHMFNFPDSYTEVHSGKRPNYVGVGYFKKQGMWSARRWSRKEKKYFFNGYHNDERKAASASDNLARKLIANGEYGHKLNFPDDDTDVDSQKPKATRNSNAFSESQTKRKRDNTLEKSQSKKYYQI